uniref:Uncharacterized protein n=1 Tax=Thermofilum pendens TaxID=2269 RepID=A0A7C4B9L6_THEPE
MYAQLKGHDFGCGKGLVTGGMKKEVEHEAILFVGEDPESAELLKRLAPSMRERIRIVNVNGLRGWLYVEYGTSRTPLLVTESRVVTGLQEILDFLGESLRDF